MVVGALLVLTAPSAFADPPNHPRFGTQAQTGLVHQPEIVAGLVSAPQVGRPLSQPEIVSGIRQSTTAEHQLASSFTQPSTDTGFNWSDAGIGAAVALGGAFLAAGCALAVRKRASLAH
jgi:hypothetical protein